MPWQERSIMAERQEFVAFASREGANIAALCRQFGSSRKTGSKWRHRAAAGEEVWDDRSRAPHTSPLRTSAAIEERVLALRAEHETWGGRQLHHKLRADGVRDVPAPSTITAILRRHGRLAAAPPPRDCIRFEHPLPNALWQLDFMGHRPLDDGRVHPLTLVDDHSRFALAVEACPHEQQELVRTHLTAVFRCYGLPRIILSANGSPWASAGMGGSTALEAWLRRLGIAVWHGRPRHPQTQGKIERFHGAIAADVFGTRQFPDLVTAQAAFARFRTTDNHERPHEALDYAVPASRYQPSPRSFPETLPPLTHGPDDAVRVVTVHGSIQWQRRRHFVSRGLVGQPVAVRPTRVAGCYDVIYGHRQVARIDLTGPKEV